MPTNKYIPRPPYGILQPTTPPTAVKEDVAMDFIIGLPAFQGHSFMVVADQFSKTMHFGKLPSHISACKATELFTQMICKLHGYLGSIMSDRDPISIGQFWQHYFTSME